jgi:hypothetical protein
MKVKRWDMAEYITLRSVPATLWYAARSRTSAPGFFWRTCKSVVRAGMLKIGLAKPYEWEEFEGWEDER